MKPTTILMNEHQVILRVLASLEAMARKCRDEGKLDGESAETALDFFREYADRCHHAKEEAHFFPLLEARGLPRDGGPTGVMLHEHDQARACVRGMGEEIDAAAKGEAPAVERFCTIANDYIALLRQHIDKEDTCLVPIAEETLSADDMEILGTTFHRVQYEEIGEETHQKYIQIADQLAERFGVATPAAVFTDA